MVVAAAGISATVELTASPIPIPRAAAITICVAEPASRIEFHHGFFFVSSSAVSGGELVDVGVRRTPSFIASVFSADMVPVVRGALSRVTVRSSMVSGGTRPSGRGEVR